MGATQALRDLILSGGALGAMAACTGYVANTHRARIRLEKMKAHVKQIILDE